MSDNNYALLWSERPAVPALPGPLAQYDAGRPGRYVTTPIYALSVAGHALVFDEGDHRLVRTSKLRSRCRNYSIDAGHGHICDI